MDNSQIESLVAEKSEGAQSLRLLWKQAIASLHPLCGDNLPLLVTALPDPTAARLFAKYLSFESDPLFAAQQFLEEVDQSEQSLKDWLKGFQVLAAYLETRSTKASLASLCGYLHCCDAAARITPGTAFPVIVETMLASHGFEGED